MSTELSTKTATSNAVSIYGNIPDVMTFCREIGKDFMVTFGLNSPHHGTVMALTCLAENIPPTTYNKRYHGDGSMRASSIQAMFLERGGTIEWLDIGESSGVAKAKFSNRANPNGIVISYSIEDGRRQVGAKFDKDGSNWATNPGAMLRAALIRKAIKIIDPGIIGGYDAFDDIGSSPTPTPIPQSHAAEPVTVTRAQADEPASVESGAIVDAKFTVIPEVAPFLADDDEPTTVELLTELSILGQQIESIDNPGRLMAPPEIVKILVQKFKLASYRDATKGQVRSLIADFRRIAEQQTA